MTAVERAKELGTYGQPDRSAQYPLYDQKLVHKAINECWTKVHQLESAGHRKDEEIAELKKHNEALRKSVSRYRIANIALTSLITSALTAAIIEGAKALLTR